MDFRQILNHARRGVHQTPTLPGLRHPAIKGSLEFATTDIDTLKNWNSNGYAGQQPAMNGASNKRGRDDDDDARPSSRGPGGVDVDGLKRRKTIREGSVSGPPAYEPVPLNRARTTITQRRR